jgi:hypothetical protein
MRLPEYVSKCGQKHVAAIKNMWAVRLVFLLSCWRTNTARSEWTWARYQMNSLCSKPLPGSVWWEHCSLERLSVCSSEMLSVEINHGAIIKCSYEFYAEVGQWIQHPIQNRIDSHAYRAVSSYSLKWQLLPHLRLNNLSCLFSIFT